MRLLVSSFESTELNLLNPDGTHKLDKYEDIIKYRKSIDGRLYDSLYFNDDINRVLEVAESRFRRLEKDKWFKLTR